MPRCLRPAGTTCRSLAFEPHSFSLVRCFVVPFPGLPGTIDATELGDALRKQGVSVTDAKVATLISVADADHDGSVDFEEFLVVMA